MTSTNVEGEPAEIVLSPDNIPPNSPEQLSGWVCYFCQFYNEHPDAPFCGSCQANRKEGNSAGESAPSQVMSSTMDVLAYNLDNDRAKERHAAEQQRNAKDHQLKLELENERSQMENADSLENLRGRSLVRTKGLSTKTFTIFGRNPSPVAGD